MFNGKLDESNPVFSNPLLLSCLVEDTSLLYKPVTITKFFEEAHFVPNTSQVILIPPEQFAWLIVYTDLPNLDSEYFMKTFKLPSLPSFIHENFRDFFYEDNKWYAYKYRMLVHSTEKGWWKHHNDHKSKKIPLTYKFWNKCCLNHISNSFIKEVRQSSLYVEWPDIHYLLRNQENVRG